MTSNITNNIYAVCLKGVEFMKGIDFYFVYHHQI
jgi:hypothetical protein